MAPHLQQGAGGAGRGAPFNNGLWRTFAFRGHGILIYEIKSISGQNGAVINGFGRVMPEHKGSLSAVSRRVAKGDCVVLSVLLAGVD